MTCSSAVPAAASRFLAGAVTLLFFACGDITAPPPGPAELKVINSTTGAPIPGGGYAVTLDGVHSIRLQTNGSHVFANLTAGEHTLELSELPGDCRVTGNNPRTVTAVAGATALSVFLVRCFPPNSGTLFIRTATYGKGPARYEISVDDGLFSELIGPSDELTLFPVAVGVHTVTLTPIHRDCQLVGANPRIVIIRQAGGFGGTIFKVHCPQ
jgi:hypothetical protein